MTSISQSDFLQALGWAVLNSLWQMALLWVIYQVLTAAFKINKPAQRSTLSTFLLFAGFAWFTFTFFLILFDNRDSSASYATFITINGNEDLNRWLYTTLPIASLVYLSLLILPVLNFVRNYRYVQDIRRYGLSKADVQWRMFVKKVSAQMGILKPVQIWMSEFVSSPVTIGFMKPVILLPMAAVNHLSPQQIEAVLLHELSHIRRFDYLVNLITRIIQTVLYFNPFVKAFARIIEREREKSCDDMVMQFQYEPHGYASALLELEKAAQRSAQSLAVAAAGDKKNELLSRVESILGIQKKAVFSFNKLAGVLAGLLCFIALNALLIASRPGKSNASNGDFFTQLSYPYLFMNSSSDASQPPVVAVNERKMPAIINDHIPQAQKPIVPTVLNHITGQPMQANANAEQPALAATLNQVALSAPQVYSFTPVSVRTEVMPQLTVHEEEQVKAAMDASKKVIEETQWKVMEKNIADAMTLAEKNQVKAAYQNAMNKADWDKLAEKVRLAYDQIDWNTVNAQLNSAMTEIRMDSLQQVYTMALTSLGTLKEEMVKNGEKGIPDSDISMKALTQTISDIQKQATKLRAVRNKKVIHL